MPVLKFSIDQEDYKRLVKEGKRNLRPATMQAMYILKCALETPEKDREDVRDEVVHEG